MAIAKALQRISLFPAIWNFGAGEGAVIMAGNARFIAEPSSEDGRRASGSVSQTRFACHADLKETAIRIGGRQHPGCTGHSRRNRLISRLHLERVQHAWLGVQVELVNVRMIPDIDGEFVIARAV